MNRLKAITIASCLFLLAVAFLPSSKADEWNKKTIITINEPLAIPGKVLQPGTYVMKLLDSPAERHIVQIFNQDESQIQATVVAMPNYRLEPTDKTQFAFWEMPAGQPRALKAWFYPGDNFGQEFAYPKDLASTIAKNNSQNVPTVSTDNSNQIAGMTTPSGETQPLTNENCNCQQQNKTSAENSTASSQTSTMASNQPVTPPEESNTQSSSAAATQPNTAATQPSASASASASAAPAPENQSAANSNMNQSSTGTTANSTAANTNTGRTLPRTASPFPLVGLAGLLSAAAAFAARRVRNNA